MGLEEEEEEEGRQGLWDDDREVEEGASVHLS